MFETDEALVTRFANGDEGAFAALVTKWRDHVLNFGYQFLGNEEMARDVSQEVLLRLYLSLKKFRGKAKFSTFLYRIIKNCCIDTHRKNCRNAKEISFDDLNINDNRENNIPLESTSNPVTETPLDIVHREDIGEKVRQALMELSEDQRMVIIMKEYSQMRFAEIAHVTGTPESTVKSRMYKGLVNLKKILYRSGIKDWSDIE